MRFNCSELRFSGKLKLRLKPKSSFSTVSFVIDLFFKIPLERAQYRVVRIAGFRILERESGVGVYYDQVKRWKAKDWARSMVLISGDGSTDLVDHAVAMAFGQSYSSNYVRIQANGSSLGRCGPNIDSDPSPSNVKMLVGIADEMLKQRNVELVLFGGKKKLGILGLSGGRPRRGCRPPVKQNY